MNQGLRAFPLWASALVLAACSAGKPDTEQSQRSASESLLTATPEIVAGATKGSYSVDATGGATYAIPIVVPPGTAGVQPNLTLAYSSRGPNGLAGKGWSIVGLGSIGRCSATIAQDQNTVPVRYAATDRFCADGQILIQVATGTGYVEYRTEMEAFSRIRAYGGTTINPDYWEVKTRTGETIFYGQTADSKIEAQGSATNIRVWALSKSRDAKGNYYSVSYTENNAAGEFYPVRIAYTGNDGVAGQIADNQSVSFVYEAAARPDPTTTYVYGDIVKNTVRLSKIKTYAGPSTSEANMVREYQLGYQSAPSTGRSRLLTLRECVGDGANGKCYAPTTFTYQNTGTTQASAATWSSSGITSKERTGDFNGDGVTDLFDIRGGAAYVYLSNKTSLSTAAQWGTGFGTNVQAIRATDMNADGKTDLVQFDASGNATAWISTGSAFGAATAWGSGLGSDPSRIFIADVNADAMPDAVSISTSGVASIFYGYAVTLGGRPVAFSTTATAGPTGLPSELMQMQVADFDGDGKTDLLAFGFDGTSITSKVYSAFATTGVQWGSGHGLDYSLLRSGDVNGDGKQDVILLGSNTIPNVWLSNGKGFSGPFASAGTGYAADQVIDVNGDERADLVYFDPIGQKYIVRLSNGLAFNAGQQWGVPGLPWYTADAAILPGSYLVNAKWTSSTTVQRYSLTLKNDGTATATGRSIVGGGVLMGSFTGTWSVSGTQLTLVLGGQSDVWTVSSSASGFALARVDGHSVGSTPMWMTYTGLPVCLTSAACYHELQYGDFNGDGRVDVLALSRKDGMARALMETSSGNADALVSVVNGLGHQVLFAYAPLTDSAVYTKGTSASYPNVDFIAALPVVKTVQESNGLGGFKSTNFTYSGANLNGLGRGFGGFATVTQSQTLASGTVLKTVTTYQTSFPYSGHATRIQKYAGATLVSDTTNTWVAHLYAQSGQLTRQFPYTSQTVVTGTDLSGTALPTTTTTYVYDTWGNMTSSVTTSGGITTTTTNVFAPADTTNWVLGRLTRATSAVSNGTTTITRVVSFAYDPTTGMLTGETIEPDDTQTDPLKAVKLTTTRGYDAWGNKVSEQISGVGIVTRTSTNTFGAQGRFATTKQNTLGQVATSTFDTRHGGTTSVTDINGISAQTAYDGFGRIVSTTSTSGVVTTTTYSGADPSVANSAYKVTQTAPASPTVIVYSDVLGREIRRSVQGFTGAYVHADTVFDADGRPIKKSIPYAAGDTVRWTQTAYDAIGRPTQVTFPDATTKTTAYDGLKETITNSKGQVSVRVMNARGKLVSTTDPNLGVTTFTYDPAGNLLTTTDPAGNVTTMTYDLRGYKLTMTDPDLGLINYRYNVLGELKEQDTPNLRAQSKKIAMSYDVYGRTISRDDAGVVSTWTYDTCTKGVGRLCTASAPGYSRSLAYDALGRESTETVTLDTTYVTTMTYDGNGRLSTVAYPSGLKIQNNYTTLGYLSSVTDFVGGNAYWTANTVDAAGALTKETLGNSLVTQRTFDPNTRLVTNVKTGTAANATSIQNMTFGYDSLGNLQSRADTVNGLTETFGYDSLNRLTTTTTTVFQGAAVATTLPAGAPPHLALTYDGIGNITTKSGVGTYAYNYVPTGRTARLPHAVSSAGSNSYTYDANGNMLSGASRTLTWTTFDAPLSISHTSGASAAFSYGPEHQRVKQVSNLDTTYYVSSIFEKVVAGAVISQRAYIRAGGNVIAVQTKQGSTIQTRYLHKDHLGSTVAITNEAGGIVESFGYDSFGVRRNANGTARSSPALVSGITRGYTGHETLDYLGLVHMNGRVHDPVLGRFLSADPMIQNADQSQELNRYTYVGNNPLSSTDPSGFFSLKKLFRAVVGIAAIVVAAFFGPQILAVLQSALGAAWAAVAVGAIAGAIGGFVFGGTLKSTLMGGLTGAIFGFVGWATAGNPVLNVAAHGMTGGVLNKLQGGDFASGFVSAAFSAMAAPAISGAAASITKNVFLRACVGAAISAVVGGVTSVVMGGKFENGALTSAYGHLFNSALHEDMGRAIVTRMVDSEGSGHFWIEIVDADGKFVTAADWMGRPMGQNGLTTYTAEEWVAHKSVIREVVDTGQDLGLKIHRGEFPLQSVRGAQAELQALVKDIRPLMGKGMACGSLCAVLINAGNPALDPLPVGHRLFKAVFHTVSKVIPVWSIGVIGGALMMGASPKEALAAAFQDWADDNILFGSNGAN